MNGILAVLEQDSGCWHRMSWEALAAAQQLARATDQPVWAAVAGNGIESFQGELSAASLSGAWLVCHPLLATYTPDAYADALHALIERCQPSVVLFPHTYQTRDYAPKLAARCGQSLLTDVVAIRPEQEGFVFTRQAFLGKLQMDCRVCGGPAFVSLQSGAYSSESVEAGYAPVETFVPLLRPEGIRTRPGEAFRDSAAEVDLTTAERIVAVGRGIQEESNLALVEELAAVLGAEVAASRPVCDNGWLPLDRQVGSSGQTVSPRLYMAVGISGAIQHIVGMRGSKTIVAINKDSEAPIFEVADAGIVGDLFEVLPPLIEEIRNARG